jgi:hypothetical protein
MRVRAKATYDGAMIATILWLLLPISIWAGTFEAPTAVQADATGSFSFEVIYTPGPRECLNWGSVDSINTDVDWFLGDGFCLIPLDPCVPISVGGESWGPISGSLSDPTALGIVEVGFSTACDPWDCWTPTPTSAPPATPAPTATPVPGCPTDPGGEFSANVQIVPFGGTPVPSPGTPKPPTPTPTVRPSPTPTAPIQGEVKAKVQLKFKKPSKDKIGVKIKNWALPMGLVPVDVTVNVGGAELTGTLDAEGKYKSADGRESIKMKEKNGLWKVTVKRKKNDFAATLADDGLTDADNPKPGLPVTVPLSIDVGGVAYGRDVDLVYTSKLGKKGVAK